MGLACLLVLFLLFSHSVSHTLLSALLTARLISLKPSFRLFVGLGVDCLAVHFIRVTSFTALRKLRRSLLRSTCFLQQLRLATSAPPNQYVVLTRFLLKFCLVLPDLIRLKVFEVSV